MGRREGPSMAQRGYLGIHAEVPTAQYLRSASVVNGASRSRSRSKAKQERGVYPASVWLIHRYREQARSHMGVVGVHSICTRHKKMWERACSRWRRHSQHHHKLTLRFREQARSHMGLWVFTASHLYTTQKNVGASLLAMASAQPTSPQTAPPLSRASPLPHGVVGVHSICTRHKKPVGASLLAMASAQPTSPQTAPPLSRASSLPHGGCRCSQHLYTTQKNVGAHSR